MLLVEYFTNNWKYSNAPEGQAPFEKVVGLTKYGVAASFGVGVYDCIMISQAYTFWKALNCMSFWMVPATCMCATFASVAYTTTKLRGKDGYANYILASMATGGVFYQWQKKGPLSYQFTFLLTACAVLKKFAELNGYIKFPKVHEIQTLHTTFPYDFTLTKDPRGRRPWE